MYKPRLITFDFGDTLVTSEPAYLERTAMALADLGHERSHEEVQRAYFRADLMAADMLLPHAPIDPEHFRNVFGSYFFQDLGLTDQAAEIGPQLAEWLIELRPKRVLMPGSLELLEELHYRGYPMAIISNNDGFTSSKCESAGIKKYFQFILDSTVEGIMKPDPRIFRVAAARSGLRPHQILHVGDLWGCDVMGAQASDMPAVWLGNDFIDPKPVREFKRIDGLLELLDLVEK